MEHNYSAMIRSAVVLLVIVNFIPCNLQAMEMKIVTTNEEAKIRAKFYLGEILALGKNGKKDINKAREYFEQVAAQNIDKEACAWSCLWLSKFNIDNGVKEGVEEYLKKAAYYQEKERASFIERFAGLLREYDGGKLDEEKSKQVFDEAVKKGAMRALEFLLSCGVSAHNWFKFLVGAAYAPRKEVVKLLLANGCAIGATDKQGWTVLHWLSYWGRKSGVEMLLANGAVVEAIDKHGRTALHLAAERYNVGIAQLLQAYGASIEVKDKDGKTPLDYMPGLKKWPAIIL